jgi:tRNA threonylcarbamoyl adenosine modification protein YeaZ|tara:strand:+ start:646 stop:1338 length:693 start_codon:yes stop_codon:yes gene_type:complete
MIPAFVLKFSKLIPKDLLIDNNSSINKDIMNFFSIDCSTDFSSLFVKIKNKTFSKVLQSDKSKIDLLMNQILDFFEENNLKLDDVSQIFVNQGPGNFSGLRGSLAIAKGVSLSKNINLFGYNTFIWACANFFNKKDSIYSIIKIREKYFIKKFSKNLSASSIVKKVTIEEIIKKYDNKIKVIPKNLIKHFDKKILKLNNINVENLDHNKLEFLKLNDLLDKDLIKPLYLN